MIQVLEKRVPHVSFLQDVFPLKYFPTQCLVLYLRLWVWEISQLTDLKESLGILSCYQIISYIKDKCTLFPLLNIMLLSPRVSTLSLSLSLSFSRYFLKNFALFLLSHPSPLHSSPVSFFNSISLPPEPTPYPLYSMYKDKVEPATSNL